MVKKKILRCRKNRDPKTIIIERATQKVERQLDIVRVTKALRRIDLLSKIILSEP
jgi:hypothetical protein